MPYKDPEYRKKYNREHKKENARYSKTWRAKHPKKVKAQSAKYAKKNKELNRKNLLKSRYGITPEEYNQMYDLQQGRCNICGEFKKRAGDAGSDGTKVLCIDHNHKTNKVRKLLCNFCNRLLGYAKDSQEILKSAIAYLEAND